MKIAVIGTKNMKSMIEGLIDELPEVGFIYCCTEYFDEAARIAEDIQKKKSADAILFSGPTVYNHARRRVTPVIPWAYLPHSRVAAFQTCLYGMAVYHSDLRAVSIDQFSEELLREAMEEVGIINPTIIRAKEEPEKPDFEKRLLDFHRSSYREGRVSICFTSMEHIAGPLRAEGIPCVRIYPVKEVLQEQVYNLQIRYMSLQKNRGSFAVIAVRIISRCKDERYLMFQEYDEMRIKNEYREKIYRIAQRMEAAVFSGDNNLFFIVTTGGDVRNIFLKDSTYWDFGQLGKRFPDSSVRIGIGMGSSMLEAKTSAVMALNKSVGEKDGAFYLMEDGAGSRSVSRLEGFSVSGSESEQRSRLAQRLHLSPATLKKLVSAIEESGGTADAARIAEYLGITPRSANRIIAKLEDEGYATVIGKSGGEKGRPKRIVKIELPLN